MVPETALREKTSAFEAQVFTHAESRPHYLRRIAQGLSNVERQVAQSRRRGLRAGGDTKHAAPAGGSAVGG